MENKPLTAFDKFVARRIAEFPTLYKCATDVITNCILGSRGDCFWKDGVLVQPNQHWNGKHQTQYPLRMPLKTAAEMHSYKAPRFSYDTGSNARAPIENIPRNAAKSFLDEIDSFLYKWGRFGRDEWQAISTAYCITMWGVAVNKHASEPERSMDGYERFMKAAPKWRATIREIEHFQEHGEIDIRTFQAENI